MRLKLYYLLELIIIIIFPFLIFSNGIPYNSVENNNIENYCTIENFFFHDCKMKFKNQIEEEIFKEDLLDMLNNGSLFSIVNQNYQREILKIVGYETYHLFKAIDQSNYDNLTYIDFSNCFRGIGDEQSYYILKIENKISKRDIPIIEYYIFKDNICCFGCYNNEDAKLKYYIPVPIDFNIDDLYIYNMSDKYYYEECIPYKSKNGTDISMYTRKHHFNTKFISPCEVNCTFKGLDFNQSKFICECQPKFKFASFDDLYEMEFTNKTNLIYQFDIEPKLTNFDVIKCYYLIASVEYITHNPGFYLLSIILLFLFIIILLFIFKGYNSLSQRIDEAIKMKFHPKLIHPNKNLIVIKIKIKHKINNNKIKKNNNNNNNKSRSSKNMKKDNKSAKNINIRRNVSVSNNNLLTCKVNDPRKYQVTNSGSLNGLNEEKGENIYTFENDYELNMLNFDQALQCDNREFCDIYRSFIKNKQLIFFSLCDFNSYNSAIIKKVIFFLSFIYHYGINAFFFTDEILDSIFEEEGKYNPMILVPNSAYSAIITTVLIKLMVDFLVLTEKKVLQIKNEKTEEKANQEKNRLMKITCIKLFVFFFINIILLVFFWFYLTCFNAVYPNTQIFLVINTAISFVISNIFPFIYYIIPAFIKNDILSNKNIRKIRSKTSNEYKDAEYVHSIGMFFQKF